MRGVAGCLPGPRRDCVIGPSARGELVTIANGAGVLLDGIIYCPTAPQVVVVHVHGSLGNFYQQGFVRVLANSLMDQDVGLLAFNLSAHDGIAEGYTPSGDMQYVGGSVVRFETCLSDLDALLGLARSIAPRVVLQGHSLGCDRVLFYVERRGLEVPLVLLSPCDSHRLQEDWLRGEAVSAQVRRLSGGSRSGDEPVELVAPGEYGVNGPDGWTYSIPVGREALLSIMTGAPFKMLRLDQTPRVVSEAPALVYLGTEDAIRGATLEGMARHVRRLIPAARILTLAGGHSLDGCEDSVASEILSWARSIALLRGPD